MSSREIEAFISRWSAASPSERANSQLFLAELCDVLAVPRPDPNHAAGYAFEHPVTEHHPDGSTSEGRTIRILRRLAGAVTGSEDPLGGGLRGGLAEPCPAA